VGIELSYVTSGSLAKSSKAYARSVAASSFPALSLDKNVDMFVSRADCFSMAAHFFADGLETRLGRTGSGEMGGEEEKLLRELVCKVEGGGKGNEVERGSTLAEEEEGEIEEEKGESSLMEGILSEEESEQTMFLE
jgi:hypothetical protein